MSPAAAPKPSIGLRPSLGPQAAVGDLPFSQFSVALTKSHCANSGTIAPAGALSRGSRVIATMVPWGVLDTSTRA